MSGAGRRLAVFLVGLGVLLTGVLPAVQATLAPVAYHEPEGTQVHHGIATPESRDRWDSGCMLPASNTYHLALTILDEHGRLGSSPVLALEAEDSPEGEPEIRRAEATPSSPARLDVVQECYASVEFTVEAVHVSTPTKYRVECWGGCSYQISE